MLPCDETLIRAMFTKPYSTRRILATQHIQSVCWGQVWVVDELPDLVDDVRHLRSELWLSHAL